MMVIQRVPSISLFIYFLAKDYKTVPLCSVSGAEYKHGLLNFKIGLPDWQRLLEGSKNRWNAVPYHY